MRKPLIKQLAHVCIFTRDLDKTETFYREVLGVQKAFSFMKDGHTIGFYLDVGGRTFIEVFVKDEASFSESDQINHICLETHDITAFVAHAESQGVQISQKRCGVDQTWQCWLTGPNGVKLEISQYSDHSVQFAAHGGVLQADW